jgi:integrase/recombinase XerD
MSRPVSPVSRVVVRGPLAQFADAYGAELKERGYTALTTVNALRQMARLSRWLEASGLAAADLSGERIERFLAVQRAEGRRGACSRPALRCLLDVLRGLRVLTAEEPVRASSANELLLASFERYLLGERGLAAGTAAGYVRHAAGF